MNKIKQALQALQAGKMIILTDDKQRENEGDLIVAAEKITPEQINFMCQHARGLICMPMAEEYFQRLNIPMMTAHNNSKQQTAFGVSIGAATGISTGISAYDRAHTIKTAANPQSSSQDIVMPGHIFPLKAKQQGVLVRQGHTEGAIDLMRLAGLHPAAAICEIMRDDGSMARSEDLEKFALKHQLMMISVTDILQYRLQTETIIQQMAETQLPVQHNHFNCRVFKSMLDGQEHVALINPTYKQVPLVRLHSECLTGDVFGSLRCDCGAQLTAAKKLIAEQGGILIYLRQEGRGIGLVNKIKAYALQDQGLDTVEANHQLGFVADQRDYALAAHILKACDINQVRLLTNNPHKITELEFYGIKVVERVPLITNPNQYNHVYLKTKREKMGHLLES